MRLVYDLMDRLMTVFLQRGVTLANFNRSGRISLMKDSLMISHRRNDIYSKNKFRRDIGMLKGPTALPDLKELMTFSTSVGVTGETKKRIQTSLSQIVQW